MFAPPFMRYILLLLVIGLFSCKEQKVDLIVYNAHIYTVDNIFSVAEAMVIDDGKVVRLGKKADLMDWFNPQKEIDAKGAYIYPGFIDAHSHFKGYGQSLF